MLLMDVMCTLLTLSACARVTVVVLCVWVCLLLDYLLHTSFSSLKCVIAWFLVMFKWYALSWFCWKYFVLQFCHHSLSTAAFHAPWRVLKGHDKYQWAIFKIQFKVHSFNDSFYKTTANKIFSELTGKLVDSGRPAVGDTITCDRSGI